MNVLSAMPASGRFGPARTVVSRPLTLLLALWVTLLHAAYPEQPPRAEPALLQPVAQPAAVQRPLQSVSSLQPGFVPAADGYTASTQDYAVQLHSTGVSHGHGSVRVMVAIWRDRFSGLFSSSMNLL